MILKGNEIFVSKTKVKADKKYVSIVFAKTKSVSDQIFYYNLTFKSKKITYLLILFIINKDSVFQNINKKALPKAFCQSGSRRNNMSFLHFQ